MLDKIVLGVWGVGLVTAPAWGSAVLMATLMMNDANQGVTMERCQMGCLVSLLAEPFAMAYSVYQTYYYGYSHTAAILPIIPIVSYAVLLVKGFSGNKRK